MRQGTLRFAVLALVVSAAASLSADPETTSLRGLVSGRELCEQAVCGSAIFAAGFAGEIDGRSAVGLAIGSIVHTTLPQAVGECATILGGRWSINTLRRTLSGDVAAGGHVCYVDGVKYLVQMTMNISQGGNGAAQFNAVLDHGPFPPTIKGAIGQ
jgi:hypothetical protein